MRRIVVLGGGYAGSICAARLAKRGEEVTLIDANDGMTERIRLHQAALGDDVPLIPFRRLFRRLHVDVVRARVTAIDRAERMVKTSEGSIAYDRLVYALGSTIDLDSVPGVREHALSLSGPAAARRVFERLQTASRVLVVGGGLTAIEMASEIIDRMPRLDVTIAASSTVGGELSPRAFRHLHDWFAARGVHLREQARVVAVDAEGATLEDGQRLDADLVLWCGAFDVPTLAWDSGLRVNQRGQIAVDDHLRSSDPHIYAIGDAAAFRDVRMSCASALPMGAYVADHLAGATAEPFRFAFAVKCISLGRGDGIIQPVLPDDTARETCITGRPAAWIKEFICRYAATSVRLETVGVHYSWPKSMAA